MTDQRARKDPRLVQPASLLGSQTNSEQSSKSICSTERRDAQTSGPVLCAERCLRPRGMHVDQDTNTEGDVKEGDRIEADLTQISQA